MMAVKDYCWVSVNHGHHVYKAIWMPETGRKFFSETRERQSGGFIHCLHHER